MSQSVATADDSGNRKTGPEQPDELALFNAWTELRGLLARDEPHGRLLLGFRPVLLAAIYCLDKLQTKENSEC